MEVCRSVPPPRQGLVRQPLRRARPPGRGRPRLLPYLSEAPRIAVFSDHKPANTLLGVKTLAEPGCAIEVP
jgi:hypothetical protein